MTIELVTPLPRSTIGAGDSVSFSVADTYTQMDIQADGENVYTTAGGPQAGYTVKVEESGSNHIFTIKKTAGWTARPTVIQVTEDQDTDVRITVFSYDLPAQVRFPRQVNPSSHSDFIKLRVSEDDGTPIEEVSHIDLVSGTPPDGLHGSGSPPRGEIDATAATTDPDALHDNVANEISPLTDKGIDATTLSDWAVLEDSEDSWAKKRCTVQNLVGISAPSKLDADFGCQLLYLFNGDTSPFWMDNEGALTNTQLDPLYVWQSHPTLFDSKSGGDHGYILTNDGSSNAQSVTLPNIAALQSPGEMTIQWIGQIGGDAIVFRGGTAFAHGLPLIALKGQNADDDHISWALYLRQDGVDASRYYPCFMYHDQAATTLIECKATDTVCTDYGRYIIQGRRQANGIGSYTVTLWVNGLKVAELTEQVAGYDASIGGYGQRLGHGPDAGNAGLERAIIFCSKMSNIALTDAQINSEYKKALGYT